MRRQSEQSGQWGHNAAPAGNNAQQTDDSTKKPSTTQQAQKQSADQQAKKQKKSTVQKAKDFAKNHPKTVKAIVITVQVLTFASGFLDEGASDALLPEEEAAGEALEAGASETTEAGEAAEGTGSTTEVETGPTTGQDGSTSQIIRTRGADGQTESVTHRVTNPNGKVIHQHTGHIGKEGGKRVFPDKWLPPGQRKIPQD